MNYLYILNDDDICVEICNFYDEDDIEGFVNGRKYLILNEEKAVLDFKFVNGEFQPLNLKVTSEFTDVETMLAQIMLDLQKIKSQLEVK